MRKKLVVLTGAGISAESGIKTFRGNDGLWENHRVEDVATPEAWQRNPELVLRFYNERRAQMHQVKPNAAHLALAQLESQFDVHIITQNVDNLHERAGSTKVLHLHGELSKARSTGDPRLVYEITGDIRLGDACEKGFQLRPHIVWFGEMVPMIEPAADLVRQADLLMIIGTSMQVYPAAGLVQYAHPEIKKYYIDPEAFAIHTVQNLEVVCEKAGVAMPRLMKQFIAEFGNN
ncbi:MAG: SIR2 family NAD-dependent protein deacylase [Flavobacteriales bacterium]